MIKVVFKEGTEKKFDVDGWNFSDISNNNVWLIGRKEVKVHLNWKEVLYIEELE